MADFLRLMIRAPLMGAGGVALGAEPGVLPVPGRSMVTGLLGAALGIERHEGDRLQCLQDGIEHAVVVIRGGELVLDYHTADLTQPHMSGPWLMRGGRVFDRGGSTADTVVRRMPYLADVELVLLIEVRPESRTDVWKLHEAVQHPCWPLYLGRRSCPAGWLDPEVVADASLAEAAYRQAGGNALEIWVPAGPGEGGPNVRWLPDRRDWRLRQHGGSTPYHVTGRGG
jgi:CRISPR system Cascade subunit CasD